MFQKMVADGVTFLLKHSYGPQSSTKRHHRCCDEDVLKTYTENFGKYAEKRI